MTAAIPSIQLLPSINKGRGRLFHITDSAKSIGLGTKQIVPIFTYKQPEFVRFNYQQKVQKIDYENVSLFDKIVFSLIFKDYN